MNVSEQEPQQEHEMPAQEQEMPAEEPKRLSPFEQFTLHLNGLVDPAERLKVALAFMEASINDTIGPRLKDFWAARSICLPLFKEGEGTGVGGLWRRYTDLSSQAKRLSEQFQEESDFAQEQFDRAIAELETNLGSLEQVIQEWRPAEELPEPRAVQRNFDYYLSAHRRFDFYNTYATRLHSLRKELIQTDMTGKGKHKLFDRLSKAGDLLYPARKELSAEVTERFVADVKSFVERTQGQQEIRGPLHVVRQEIKDLQTIAKALTLTRGGYDACRKLLSGLWDSLREVEKERRERYQQKKGMFQENEAKVLEKINELAPKIAEGEISTPEADKAADEIRNFMRSVELGREEVANLRDKLNEALAPIDEKRKAEEQERRQRDAERSAERAKYLADLQARVDGLLGQVDTLAIDEVEEEGAAALAAVQESNLPKSEKLRLERLLRPLKKIIIQKREEALLALSDDDKQALANLRQVLAQRSERRREIKERAEAHRKAKGNSGLDFEQALEASAKLEQTREELAEADQGVAEIQAKIDELESSL